MRLIWSISMLNALAYFMRLGECSGARIKERLLLVEGQTKGFQQVASAYSAAFAMPVKLGQVVQRPPEQGAEPAILARALDAAVAAEGSPAGAA